LDASYFDMRAIVPEHDPLVLGAETVKRWDDLLQALHIALLRVEESSRRV
jgi:hypothetical protein